jgi:hypothetical protein
VGLAVDVSFLSSRSVFVAWTSDSADGVTLNVTRYRELDNVLAEGATIVTGLPFQDGLRAPLAVDGDGLLYVAVPSTTSTPASILRFTRDGFTPRSNPAISPRIADGFARPSDLAIDPATKRIWMSGEDPGRPYSVATSASADALMNRITPEPVLGRVAANEAPMLALVRRWAQDPTASLLVARGSELLHGDITAPGAGGGLRRLPFASDALILSVAEGPAGSWYVLTGVEGETQSLLQLTVR